MFIHDKLIDQQVENSFLMFIHDKLIDQQVENSFLMFIHDVIDVLDHQILIILFIVRYIAFLKQKQYK